MPAGDIALVDQVRQALVNHAISCRPEECCGLVATDSDGRIRMVYPLTNSLHSPTRFTIEPTEQFGAVRHAERCGWDIGGVFHSHPEGEAALSPVDVKQPHDPAWFHLVVGLLPDPHIRAWRITGAEAAELAIR